MRVRGRFGQLGATLCGVSQVRQTARQSLRTRKTLDTSVCTRESNRSSRIGVPTERSFARRMKKRRSRAPPANKLVAVPLLDPLGRVCSEWPWSHGVRGGENVPTAIACKTGGQSHDLSETSIFLRVVRELTCSVGCGHDSVIFCHALFHRQSALVVKVSAMPRTAWKSSCLCSVSAPSWKPECRRARCCGGLLSWRRPCFAEKSRAARTCPSRIETLVLGSDSCTLEVNGLVPFVTIRL